MDCRLVEQVYRAKGNRHDGECYGMVVDDRPGSPTTAWRHVNETREALMLHSGEGHPRVVVDNTTIYSPVFLDGKLLWSAPRGDRWPIFALEADRVVELPDIPGRARALSAHAVGTTGLLAWEERRGRTSRIRACLCTDGTFGPAVDITDGHFNAYDPAAAVCTDSSMVVAYSAYLGGTYTIMMQRLDRTGRPSGDPVRVSPEGAPCTWPSVHPRQAGGAWISYTAWQVNTGWEYALVGNIDFTFPNHLRRRAQSAWYTSYGLVKVGFVENGTTYTAQRDFALKSKKGGYTIKDLGVPQTFGSGHSNVFEDAVGTPWVAFRKHNPAGAIGYEKQDDMTRSDPLPGRSDPDRNYADICLAGLEGDAWSDPVRLVEHAFVDHPISLRLDGAELHVAFTQDGRSCGNEWNDHSGQLAVGVSKIQLPTTEPPTGSPWAITMPPMHGPSLQEPRPRVDAKPHRLVFGQTHVHSTLSNCGRSINKDLHLTYRFVQDVQQADFCAVTDHAFDMWHTEMLITRKAAEFYNAPGHFVALQAYEWTGTVHDRHEGGPFGHVNPISFMDDGDLDFYTPKDTDCPGATLPKLQSIYAGRPVIGIPHHPADPWHPYAWHLHDETFSPVVELFQTARGSYEGPDRPGANNFDGMDGHWVIDALKRGTHVGFIGGGEHNGLALAGVLVHELTRAALYEAFAARRTIATTGHLLELHLTCNDQPMGSRIDAEQGTFTLHVRTAEPIASVQVLRDGDEVDEVAVDGTDLERRWSAHRQRSGEFWYVRVLMANNDIAWTSPIWLD